ncbi:APC family permease [Mycoplasma procyoni]|uniref:APC family permease n=1 Tax=Mycoplasma procyoni TaxID=568784 RepID=UPI00197BA47B|nr:APC family permease [Mycoplasma procyoni]MBN3535043.1 APC family permease [Mycoplasma procyoni]
MKNKLSERQFIFFGLNYIVGFGFIATISSVISKGLWGSLIFVLTAFISMSIMLAFARASQNYANEVGGTYIYAKKAFPEKKHRWFLFLQGWNQFAQVPLFAATTPLFFGGLMSAFDQNNAVIYQVVSVAVFMIFIIISALGFRLSKWFVFISGAIKWIVIGLGLSIVVYLSLTQRQFAASFAKDERITVSIIATTVLNFTYAFAGGEGLVGISSDVKTKRFKKLLLLIFAIVLSFYFIFYLIYLGIDEKSVLTENNSISFGIIYKSVFGITGLIIFAVGTFFNRTSSSISSNIYYARTVAPLAKDGFIPSLFAKKSRNGEYKNSIVLVTIFALFAMVIFTIIPNILGIREQFSAILNAGTIVFLMQYWFSIFSILIISLKNKDFKIPIFEKIIYSLALLLIGFIVLVSFIPPIVGDAYSLETAILLPSYAGTILIGYIFWFAWYLYNKNKSKAQKELNQKIDHLDQQFLYINVLLENLDSKNKERVFKIYKRLRKNYKKNYLKNSSKFSELESDEVYFFNLYNRLINIYNKKHPDNIENIQQELESYRFMK